MKLMRQQPVQLKGGLTPLGQRTPQVSPRRIGGTPTLLRTAPPAASSSNNGLPNPPGGEEARKLARTVYDFPDWKKHRSPNRLIERLLTIQRSNIMKNIASSVAWTSSVAVLVTAYMYAFEHHDLPAWMPAIAPNQACGTFINTTSVALSLLLVFRTNNGYGRWNEARCMWGLLVNRSRDIMRQACTMMPANDLESKAALGRWMIAFTRCLRIHLQPEVTWQTELKDILRPDELEMLVKSSHKPVKCLHMMSQVIQSSQMNPILQSSLSQNITAFQDVLGGCERILRAPIPVSYTRHTARFLFVWLSVLPLALYGTCGAFTAPVVAGVSAVLCGIEEIGIQTEEPFGILPLEALCTRIQTDVLSTVADSTQCIMMAPNKGGTTPAMSEWGSGNGNGYGNGNGNGNGNGYNNGYRPQVPQLARRQ